MIGIIHIAGQVQGNVQKCARCGAVLVDYTNTMSLSDGPQTFLGWEEGAFMTVTDGFPICSQAGRVDFAVDCNAASEIKQ